MDVVGLFDDGERQHEHGIERINTRKMMIPTLIHKDEVVAKGSGAVCIHGSDCEFIYRIQAASFVCTSGVRFT